MSLSKLIAKENCSLALISKRIELLEKLKGEIENNPGKFICLKCDVSKREEVENTHRKILDHFGRIDIAILNAGIGNRSNVEEYSSKKAEEIFSINTLGLIYWIEQLLPEFMKRKTGVIVGVSSLADSHGYPRSGFYNASKSAASLLLQSLRVDLKPYNIKVITVKPGFVKTPLTDKNEFHMPFLMDSEKAAGKILNGIKKDKSIIQFPLMPSLSVMLMKLMPHSLFEWLVSKPLPPRKDKVNEN